MAKDNNSENPFIRFKNFVDDRISQTFRGFQALPSVLTEPLRDAPHEDTHQHRRTATVSPQQDTSLIKDERQQKSNGDSQETARPEVPSVSDIINRLQDQAITSWVKFSPYSPENLDTLRQPRPRDAPRDGPNCFTFRDALEDLLLASSDQRHSDIRRWSSSKHAYWDDSYVSRTRWQWETRQQGLWDAYFPKATFSRDANRIRQRILSEMGQSGYSRNEMDYYTKFLIRQAAMCDEEAAFHGITRWPGRIHPFRWLGFDDELTTALDHELNELLSPWAQLVKSANWDLAQGREDAHPVPEAINHQIQERQEDPFAEPESEEDMYLAALSELPTKDKSEENKPEAVVTSVSPAEPRNGASTETTEYPDGSKLVKTIERRSHPGMSQVTTTTQMYDASGNLVQRSVTTSQSSSYSFGNDRPDDSERTAGNGSWDTSTNQKDSKAKPRHGWFWTR